MGPTDDRVIKSLAWPSSHRVLPCSSVTKKSLSGGFVRAVDRSENCCSSGPTARRPSAWDIVMPLPWTASWLQAKHNCLGSRVLRLLTATAMASNRYTPTVWSRVVKLCEVLQQPRCACVGLASDSTIGEQYTPILTIDGCSTCTSHFLRAAVSGGR
jgi:hypothetical protein